MLRAIFGAFIDILLPPRQSERVVRGLSAEALQSLQTERGLPYHDPRVTALVWELKYHANPFAAALGGDILAPQILERAAEEVGVPLLVPVPLHPRRLKERGHNQTQVLCRAALTGLDAFEYAPSALERVVDTPHQQGLLRRKRLQNVKRSMRAHPKAVRGRVCIVVDDVTTTGATLEEAKRALRHAGARVVHTVALAYS